MKTFKLIFGLLTLVALFTSCSDKRITGSGNVVTELQDFSNIDKINISDAFNAFVTFSDSEEKIEIEADDNLLDLIEVEKVNNELHVRLVGFTFIKNNPTLNVHITTKSIAHFKASGASHIKLENTLDAPEVSITISGASDFTGDLKTDKLNLKASGASHCNLSGTTRVMTLKNSGASQFEDFGFTTEDLNIDLQGASSAKLTIEEKIDAELSGASKLKFMGDAIIENQRLSGASEIERIN